MNDQLHQTDDVFTWKDISILQKEGVFKVGTDALLLGAWVPKVLQHAESILDVGCGTGILSLIMHRAFPWARILAIDREASAVALSNINFSKSVKSDLLTAKMLDVFSIDTIAKFDLIVCNPPYFFGPHHMHNGPLSGARHANENAVIWMQKIASLLTIGGHAFLVLPYSVANDWVRGANDHGLYVADRMNVCSFKQDKDPKRVLLHFTTQLKKPVFDQMCIYKEEKQYSDEYKKFVAGDHRSTLI